MEVMRTAIDHTSMTPFGNSHQQAQCGNRCIGLRGQITDFGIWMETEHSWVCGMVGEAAMLLGLGNFVV